jgi:hypothetical protein
MRDAIACCGRIEGRIVELRCWKYNAQGVGGYTVLLYFARYRLAAMACALANNRGISLDLYRLDKLPSEVMVDLSYFAARRKHVQLARLREQ